MSALSHAFFNVPGTGARVSQYRKTDIVIFRPSTGAWFVTTLGASVTWGGSGDIPILKRP